jgi:hypothetical protein
MVADNDYVICLNRCTVLFLNRCTVIFLNRCTVIFLTVDELQRNFGNEHYLADKRHLSSNDRFSFNLRTRWP